MGFRSRFVDLSAKALTAVLAQMAADHDTAIGGSPTADSINQRIRSMDLLMEASGDGDLAAVKTRVDLIPTTAMRGTDSALTAIINSIQRGTIQLDGSESGKGTSISAVVMAKTFVNLVGNRASGLSDDNFCHLQLTTTTNIQITRSANSGILIASYEVVEFK